MCFISTCLVTYYINKQNYQYRAPKNPKEPQHRPLHSQKLTVRCGIASFWLLGPYIFEDNEGEAVIVTSERYVDMLCNFCEPELRRRGIDFSSVCFHQDGATAHTARTSMDFLREMFHSTKVFISKPRTVEELEQRTEEEIAAIPEQMTRRMMENRRGRLEQCLRNCGEYLNDEI
ncbi:hypothetical protein Cfor_10734 [Coptotermes formosanus]|uniref:Tc1-like transposase DDE domain-containing protein n=1 Tax=Coptotermes formosanus TaxID=36987 RepID=A0A6L2PFC0_COPFO|nr:hypothetical protein Cfor_10734 [Coptotermes formosanus]